MNSSFISRISIENITDEKIKKNCIELFDKIRNNEFNSLSDIESAIDDSYGDGDDGHKYKIFLGVKPNDISAFDNDEVRDYVRHISKYVLGDNETIQQILFYNSEN